MQCWFLINLNFHHIFFWFKWLFSTIKSFHFPNNFSKHFQQFSAATSPSTFIIYLQHALRQHQRLDAEERTLTNAATKEELTVRNAVFQAGALPYHYVEIMRHPIGAEANMREWVKERAYYEKTWNPTAYGEEEQVIWINRPSVG